MNESSIIRRAAEIAKDRALLRPWCGSPDGQDAHDEGVAISALVEAGETRPMYKGVAMPWCQHPMFDAARASAWRAVCG
jgi:hypothetical protein